MEESSSNSFKQKQTQCINFYKKYKKYVFDKSYYKVENIEEYKPSKNVQNQVKSKLAIIVCDLLDHRSFMEFAENHCYNKNLFFVY